LNSLNIQPREAEIERLPHHLEKREGATRRVIFAAPDRILIELALFPTPFFLNSDPARQIQTPPEGQEIEIKGGPRQKKGKRNRKKSR